MMATQRQRTVVMVTDRTLFPAREGSVVRIVALVRALKRAGFRVVLVARRAPWRWLPRIPGPRSTLHTWRLADALVSVDAPAFTGGSPSAFDWTPYARALRKATLRYEPVAVLAEYLWLAPCLDVVPEGILRIVDTHDVMHVRAAMFRGQPEGAWVECDEREEAALLSHAEVIVAIQRQELETFARMLPSKRVVCIPHIAPGGDGGERTSNDPIVGFVGSRIQGNVVGLRTFIDEGWPLVRARCAGAELHVFGDVVSRLERDAPGLRLIGVVSDVREVYRSATVIINPVMLGTGLKIKTVEALAAGCALVTTRCGAAGVEEGAGRAFVMEDEMPSFAIAVAELLQNGSRRNSMGRTAQEFAASRFGEAAVVEALSALLTPVAGAHRSAASDAPEAGVVPDTSAPADSWRRE